MSCYCPAWIVEERADGYLALLGSEPRVDAVPDLLPRGCVASCVYAPAESQQGDARFAMLVLSWVPDEIGKKFPGAFQRPLT
jgi:hypothetical protein